jgi:hypothetical protein
VSAKGELVEHLGSERRLVVLGPLFGVLAVEVLQNHIGPERRRVEMQIVRHLSLALDFRRLSPEKLAEQTHTGYDGIRGRMHLGRLHCIVHRVRLLVRAGPLGHRGRWRRTRLTAMAFYQRVAQTPLKVELR